MNADGSKKAKGEDPISLRPAELMAPKWPALERKFPGLSQDEDLLIHAISSHEAQRYFEEKSK